MVTLPPNWVNADALEHVLRSTPVSPHDAASTVFCFPPGCRVMIDSAVRLLSLINQLDLCTRRVRLEFEDGETGVMGYLNRVGFFDELSRNVEVMPLRPAVSGADTHLDGYAALQVYLRGDSLQVAVSDSGRGIMQTLRPALKTEYPTLAQLSDTELLVEVFRQGLSRHGTDRGCGLKGSAAKAMKYHAKLDVRLPKTRVLLTPGEGGYRPATAYRHENLPLIWGTHICFTFQLDLAP